ncbi:cytochrome ubiquinol oxidase subunit I [Sporichthya polymorpha]|uniref:cytochrome ubiquinol oxidase subunit I n=1 Tax=Sporichthya polymorpha TaxID=35751 RepID=UPI00036CD746|nr:cytochrome ubiquinol oxidase subunit I [Sporichthya polymorpha]
MDALDLARWQFGITTVYHFLFVPITLGLSMLVAGLQTAWHRTGKDAYLRATKFWGKLLVINFAMGVVTGIVQEFQFGMNWSDYSRFVGDIFGAPLAIEGLLAFFLESTFLGLWLFGWDRLPKRVHLACVWLFAIGTWLSAYFILAANSFMQHPVGYEMNGERGRAELHDFGAVLTQNTAVVTFAHTILAALMTAGAFMLTIAAWHVRRASSPEVFRPSMRLAMWVLLIAGIGTAVSGDVQARIMTEQQPMKMAAAEAMYDTTDKAGFSLFTIGSLDGDEEIASLRVPGLLSFMATNDVNGTVEGINDIQEQYEATYGPGDYKPNIPVTYWSFRLMIGFGTLAILIALVGLWVTRRGRVPRSRLFYLGTASAVTLPLLANTFGWIFTEMGRQPWTVFGVLQTEDSVSPTVSTFDVATSLTVLTLLYGVLAAVELKLLFTYARSEPPQVTSHSDDDESDRPLAFAY